MIDYKNMSDQELLDLIDSEYYPKNSAFNEMQVLAQTDLEFADRLLNLKIKNKSAIRRTIAKINSYTEKFNENDN